MVKAKNEWVSLEKWAWYQDKYTHFAIVTDGEGGGSLTIDGVRIPDCKPKEVGEVYVGADED